MQFMKVIGIRSYVGGGRIKSKRCDVSDENVIVYKIIQVISWVIRMRLEERNETKVFVGECTSLGRKTEKIEKSKWTWIPKG